jgi:hypothetical protein
VKLPVEFLAGADSDLQLIYEHFEDYRGGSGNLFIATVDAYLTHISTFPEIAPIYFSNIRRQVMRRFPFGIFYEPYPTRVVILAVLDLRQSEEQIKSRIIR